MGSKKEKLDLEDELSGCFQVLKSLFVADNPEQPNPQGNNVYMLYFVHIFVAFYKYIYFNGGSVVRMTLTTKDGINKSQIRVLDRLAQGGQAHVYKGTARIFIMSHKL